VKRKTKLISANKDKHMHVHGGCLKLFKYCLNELYFSFAKLLKAKYYLQIVYLYVSYSMDFYEVDVFWIFKKSEKIKV
jgi:hypothetical protein